MPRPPPIPRPTRSTCTSTRTEESDMREITLSQAVNEAIAEEMRRDPTVFLIGEDVAEAGTPFKVLSGLVEEFGTGPRARHADLGARLRRHRRRRRDDRRAARRRPDVRRLHLSGHGPALQSGGQAALHVGRQADRADGAAHQHGRDPPLGRAAFPVAAGAGGAYPGSEGGDAVLGLRGEGADEDRDPGQQPGRDLRGQADVPGQGARCPRRNT